MQHKILNMEISSCELFPSYIQFIKYMCDLADLQNLEQTSQSKIFGIKHYKTFVIYFKINLLKFFKAISIQYQVFVLLMFSLDVRLFAHG